MKRKKHLPKPGHGEGLRAEARCGYFANYGTSDYELIERLCLSSFFHGEYDHYCQTCLRDLLAKRHIPKSDAGIFAMA